MHFSTVSLLVLFTTLTTALPSLLQRQSSCSDPSYDYDPANPNCDPLPGTRVKRQVGSPTLLQRQATPCTPAQLALASGIQLNIDDQFNELSTVTTLGNILNTTPFNPTLYATTQFDLLQFVETGITIRENNQAIAPVGNGAIPGLAIVANAQAAELMLTQGLAADENNIPAALAVSAPASSPQRHERRAWDRD
jgi:hypothetical protein